MLTPGSISGGIPGETWKFILIYLIYAYLFAGLPALAFAFIMSRLQRRGFRHGGVRLLAATLLGLVAGTLITFPFGLNAAMILVPLGSGVGLLVELTVIMVERHHRTPAITT